MPQSRPWAFGTQAIFSLLRITLLSIALLFINDLRDVGRARAEGKTRAMPGGHGSGLGSRSGHGQGLGFPAVGQRPGPWPGQGLGIGLGHWLGTGT